MRLTLYGKAGCHLCDEARAAVATVQEEVGFDVEEIDIASDPVLFRRYGERIPVIAVDGEDLLELRIDARSVRRAVDRVAGP